MFSPESANRDMGWTLIGYCEGTMAPTASPAIYPDQKCRYYIGTQAYIINAWSETDLGTYTAGTKVRVDDKIFKCKSFPFSDWCKCECLYYYAMCDCVWSFRLNDWINDSIWHMSCLFTCLSIVAMYKPDDDSTYWSNAWRPAGDCPAANAPT